MHDYYFDHSNNQYSSIYVCTYISVYSPINSFASTPNAENHFGKKMSIIFRKEFAEMFFVEKSYEPMCALYVINKGKSTETAKKFRSRQTRATCTPCNNMCPVGRFSLFRHSTSLGPLSAVCYRHTHCTCHPVTNKHIVYNVQYVYNIITRCCSNTDREHASRCRQSLW